MPKSTPTTKISADRNQTNNWHWLTSTLLSSQETNTHHQQPHHNRQDHRRGNFAFASRTRARTDASERLESGGPQAGRRVPLSGPRSRPVPCAVTAYPPGARPPNRCRWTDLAALTMRVCPGHGLGRRSRAALATAPAGSGKLRDRFASVKSAADRRADRPGAGSPGTSTRLSRSTRRRRPSAFHGAGPGSGRAAGRWPAAARRRRSPARC